MSALRSRDQDTMVPGEYKLTRNDFETIASTLYSDAGIHLTESKATLVYSRLAKRLRALNLESFRDYCELIGGSAGQKERQEMLSALTTNVTRFFREKHHFDHMETQVLPALMDYARRGGKVRLWSAACSSGQEPYSMALTLLAVEPKAPTLDVRILATDIDPQMVAAGTRGVYDESLLSDVPAAMKKRYFAPAGGSDWRASEELRRLVSFRELNLNADWPMRHKFQAIFCRNVVIYFDEPTQNALWNKFAAYLAPGGWLYIGHSERVNGAATALFSGAGVTAYRLKEGSGE